VNSANPISSGHVTCATSAAGGVIGVDPDGAAGPAAARPIVLLKNVSCSNALQANVFSF
jgi:hypothetical protein